MLDNTIKNAVRRLSVEGIDSFEVMGLEESRLIIEVKNQLVELFQRSSTQGIAIRVVKGGKLGFSTTTDISSDAINSLIEQSIKSLRFVSSSEETTIPSNLPSKEKFVEKFGVPLGDISDDEKIKKAMALESYSLAADGRITKVSHPRYEELHKTLHIVNSNGISVKSSRSLAFCELKTVASGGVSSESAYEFEFSTCFEDLNPEEISSVAAKRAIKKLGGKPVPSGSYNVVFGPRSASTMIKLIAPSFFADNVRRGKSIIASKKNEGVYAPIVSIIDDGLLPGGLNSFSFDGEGIPKRRTPMVLNGVVDGWLYDAARAKLDGVNSTGNCLRESLRKLPVIDVSNCFLKSGKCSSDELFEGLNRALLITELMAVHTANTITGDFSLGAEGFVISDGKVGEPVRGITIAGNVHDVFKRVQKIGSDFKFFGQYGAPSILVENLDVSG